MKTSNRNALVLLAACGTAVSIAPSALAGRNGEAKVIHFSGATLLEDLVSSPAFYRDEIDIDGDNICFAATSFTTGMPCSFSGTGDQLAPTGTLPFSDRNLVNVDDGDGGSVTLFQQHEISVQYRAIGSVNGLQELIDFGRGFVCTDDGASGDYPSQIDGSNIDTAWYNGEQFGNNGGPGGALSAEYTPDNPGGFPIRSVAQDLSLPIGASTFDATDTGITFPSNGVGTTDDCFTDGILIDAAPVDVPATWAANFDGGGTPGFLNNPLSPGYGRNPNVSVTVDGQVDGFSSFLATLTGGAQLFNGANGASPDTLFDNPIAFGPVATIVSFGVGQNEFFYSEHRHGLVTGRLPNGENLTFVTRDKGSGTRNGHNNSLDLDPSWGNGENITRNGVRSSADPSENLLGSLWVPGNAGGSGILEAKMRSARGGVGYTGAERGQSRWLAAGQLDVAGMANDVARNPAPVNPQFVRPFIDNVVFNDDSDTSFRIGGPAVLVTFGDPRNENEIGGVIGNTNARMRNATAAAFLNNYRISSANFNVGQNPPFSPGELASLETIAFEALDAGAPALDPVDYDESAVANSNLQNFVRFNNALSDPGYEFANFYSVNGISPSRLQGVTYTDGVVNGTNYVRQNGAVISYASALGGNPMIADRNQIWGDFNNDNDRDIDDVNCMIDAWNDREGGTPWTTANFPGTDADNACIEILGDFNGDGNFDVADVRYFADGLAIVGNKVDRKAGFTAVDSAFGGNFFGLSAHSTGASVQNGDARADVAGSGGFATAFQPVGFDGSVNAADIDHVYAQFVRNPSVADNELDWADTNEAVPGVGGGDVFGDFSCDINGDCLINQADVDEIVKVILGTTYGDVNLDGVANATDISIVDANSGNAGGWAQGDVNGDGIVDAADRGIVVGHVCGGDADGSLVVNFGDITAALGSFNVAYTGPAKGLGDANGDCVVNFADITAILGAFNDNCTGF